MDGGPKRISLVTKKGAPEAQGAADRLEGWLRSRGVEVERDCIGPEADAVVILGGDGTLLHVADTAYRRGIPILGINMGGLGFLTEVHMEEMEEAVEALVQGSFLMDERMVLRVDVIPSQGRDEGDPTTYYALNEAVITKAPEGRMISLSTWVDGAFLTTYRGDGLIVSTPTGSTAYNLSAGGPLIHPNIEAVVLTPICPFALSARPLLLDSSMEIEVQIPAPPDGEPAEASISVVIDGQTHHQLAAGERLRIRRAPGHLKLFRSPSRDYFAILREKLGWATGCPH